jgi:hypothetical protein
MTQDNEKLNPYHKWNNQLNKYVPHQGAKEKNRRMKKMGLTPTHVAPNEIVFHLPDTEVKIER